MTDSKCGSCNGQLLTQSTQDEKTSLEIGAPPASLAHTHSVYPVLVAPVCHNDLSEEVGGCVTVTPLCE